MAFKRTKKIIIKNWKTTFGKNWYFAAAILAEVKYTAAIETDILIVRLAVTETVIVRLYDVTAAG